MDVLERELAEFAARAVPPAPTLGSLQRRGLELRRRRRARRLTAGTALVAIVAIAGVLVAEPHQDSTIVADDGQSGVAPDASPESVPDAVDTADEAISERVSLGPVSLDVPEGFGVASPSQFVPSGDEWGPGFYVIRLDAESEDGQSAPSMRVSAIIVEDASAELAALLQSDQPVPVDVDEYAVGSRTAYVGTFEPIAGSDSLLAMVYDDTTLIQISSLNVSVDRLVEIANTVS